MHDIGTTPPVHAVICPDHVSMCPDNNTCCLLQDGKYGCCPQPHAVCCNDHKHCCPQGYTCDTSEGKCLQGYRTIPWLENNVASPVNPIDCDEEGKVKCPDKNTCCKKRTGEWGCCPLEKDGSRSPFHARSPVPKARSEGSRRPFRARSEGSWRPFGTAADGPFRTAVRLSVRNGRSHQRSGGRSPVHRPFKAAKRAYDRDVPGRSRRSEAFVKRSLNASGRSFKSNGPVPDGPLTGVRTQYNTEYSISPEVPARLRVESPNGTTRGRAGAKGDAEDTALCCEDRVHCCPHGTVCNKTSGECHYPDGTTQAWVQKTPPILDVRDDVKDVACPDGKSACEEDYTCCKNGTGYSCCPFSRAVCCNDTVHCCPQHYTCNSGAPAVCCVASCGAIGRVFRPKPLLCPDVVPLGKALHTTFLTPPRDLCP
ncbi:GRN [Branchiostoma lanceolatum]|uniref:GRN protein n=1 Tax=Branchiostoma lanceolatum TaxID=7740 RepID=A0A8J9VFR6_BRALA|nr:GRN [Branchiostoma lanceolatum]